MKYEKPLLHELSGDTMAEGWICGSGGKNNRSCANGPGAGGQFTWCDTGSSGNGCNNGTTASHCNTGTGVNSNNCVIGSGASGTCSTGSST